MFVGTSNVLNFVFTWISSLNLRYYCEASTIIISIVETGTVRHREVSMWWSEGPAHILAPKNLTLDLPKTNGKGKGS